MAGGVDFLKEFGSEVSQQRMKIITISTTKIVAFFKNWNSAWYILSFPVSSGSAAGNFMHLIFCLFDYKLPSFSLYLEAVALKAFLYFFDFLDAAFPVLTLLSGVNK